MVESQIEFIKNEITSLSNKTLSDDRVFSHLILKIFFNQDLNDRIITDGPKDGGIDFIYFNEEDNKLILGQSKYTQSLSVNNIVEELNKMDNTLNNFKKGDTAIYNDDLKRELQNGIDRLPEDQSGNVEYYIFTKANIEISEEELTKIEKKLHDGFPVDSIKVFSRKQIENAIDLFNSKIDTVSEDFIEIEKNNFLKYDSNVFEGLMCNLNSSSLVRLYNKYQSAGLFDLNIRRYIPNKTVDNGIKKTLEHERDNFWFLNNGIIIACQEFIIDGDKVRLTDFSIVNGGQTTQLIGNYKGKASSDFKIPCKIVAVKDEKKAPLFFNKIAEATNSQKPILPRDLKSNSREMISLQKMLNQHNIYLEIKRGTKKSKLKKYKSTIKNDVLGQLILSFAFQQPGTSRSGKKTIFENETIYGKLFRVNYNENEKKQFLLDIIDLYDRYKTLEAAFKDEKETSHTLDQDQMEILKNGTQIIFAILGLLYRLANEDITKEQVATEPIVAEKYPFEYGSILSNYKGDDISEKFNLIVEVIIYIVTELYIKAKDEGTVTSVSNFMKTDVRYYTEIVKRFLNYFKFSYGKEIMNNWDIFKR